MFGINKKVYYILALISGIIGIIVLGLKVFKVLPDEELYTLISLVFLMLGFVLYIRPAVKTLNIQMNLCNHYRNNFFNELTKENYDTEINLFENEDGFLQYKEFIFEGLTVEDAAVIAILLLNDYVRIIFGVMDERKKKFIKAQIESFTVKITKKDNTFLYRELIKDYQYTNKKLFKI